MARVGGPCKTCADVYRKGVKIAVGKGSAYELFLSRTLQFAELMGVDPKSDGLARARLGVLTTAEGIDGLLKLDVFKDTRRSISRH
jgi:acetaldehyde dehydrogenase (acetylating)